MQYGLKVCSTGWRCAVQAEAHQEYRLRVCSTGWENSLFCISEAVLQVRLSLDCACASACTVHSQPVLRVCFSLYHIPLACTSGVLQPVPHTLSLYCGCPSACTVHSQPVLHKLYTGCVWVTVGDIFCSVIKCRRNRSLLVSTSDWIEFKFAIPKRNKEVYIYVDHCFYAKWACEKVNIPPEEAWDYRDLNVSRLVQTVQLVSWNYLVLLPMFWVQSNDLII